MSYTERVSQRHISNLADALANSNLQQACDILTKIFRGITLGDAMDMIDDLCESEIDCSLIENCFHGVTKLILKGTRPNSRDGFMRISNIMEDLHYDNGLPLSGLNFPADNPTVWNDFFDHYDRDQDYWGFYWDCEIYNFATDGKEIFMRVNCSLADLRDYLTAAYDGASWEHDFGIRAI